MNWGDGIQKCEYHDELKTEVGVMSELSRQHLNWQAGFEVKMDALINGVKQSNDNDKEIKKCFHELSVNLAQNYVSKREFSNYCQQAEERHVKIQERFSDIAEEQRKSLWKIIGLFVPISAIVFSFITWLFGVL